MNDARRKAVDKAWNLTVAARADLLRAENTVRVKQAELDRSVRELQDALRENGSPDDAVSVTYDGLRRV